MSPKNPELENLTASPIQEPAETEVPNPETKREISPEKLAANRANALKSSGPKTPEGRAKCAAARANALIHGLRAKSVVIAGESEPRFLTLLNAYIETHRPLTEPENEAVFQMAAAIWRQRRAIAFQTMDLNRQIARLDPADTVDAHPSFLATLAFLNSCQDEHNSQGIAHRYETTYGRQYNRALRDLVLLRTLRSPTDGIEDAASLTLDAGNWEEAVSEEEEA